MCISVSLVTLWLQWTWDSTSTPVLNTCWPPWPSLFRRNCLQSRVKLEWRYAFVGGGVTNSRILPISHRLLQLVCQPWCVVFPLAEPESREGQHGTHWGGEETPRSRTTFSDRQRLGGKRHCRRRALCPGLSGPRGYRRTHNCAGRLINQNCGDREVSSYADDILQIRHHMNDFHVNYIFPKLFQLVRICCL